MLLAYIDEIGEPGAFISRDHPKFNTSPAFGYAGFILPEGSARPFGAEFHARKRELFRTEIEQADHPGRWERKGASIFRADTHQTFPQQIRVFDGLVRSIVRLGGNLFYYADEKPLGTPKQTELDVSSRETSAMQETLNRIARHADSCDSNVLVLIDQINEKTRAERLPKMYSHILRRTSDYREMRRIVEPPMHIDSQLSSNIQFADWIAACLTRAIDYQLTPDSPYEWVTDDKHLKNIYGSFTHESKLHLWERAVSDFHHSDVYQTARPLFRRPQGQHLGGQLNSETLRKMKAAAERNHKR